MSNCKHDQEKIQVNKCMQDRIGSVFYEMSVYNMKADNAWKYNKASLFVVDRNGSS